MLDTVRPAVAQDIDAVMAILHASFATGNIASKQDVLHELVDKRYFNLVTELKAKVTGVLMVDIRSKSLYLQYVAVHPNSRRHGIGQELVARTLGLALKLKKEIYLDVGVKNFSAQKLYYDVGFLPVKIMKDFYTDGEYALRMKTCLFET